MWLILCRWKKSVVRKCRIVPYILDTGLLQVSISAFHKIRLVVIEWGQFMSKIVREELVLFQRCLLNTGLLTRFVCQQQNFPRWKTMLAGLSGKAGGKRSIWSYCFKVLLFFLFRSNQLWCWGLSVKTLPSLNAFFCFRSFRCETSPFPWLFVVSMPRRQQRRLGLLAP